MLTYIKRFGFLIIVNLLVFITLNITLSLAATFLGIDLSGYQGYLVFAIVLGMGGSFISLFTSKWMAKKIYKVQIIDPNTHDQKLRSILNLVHNASRSAKLKTLPEVGIYENPEINAFATGPSKNNSLVALSSGILDKMNNDELEGVIGHEVAHIANGDMITMTLIQGVINTIVILVARIIAKGVMEKMESKSMWTYFAIYNVLQIFLSILGSVFVNLFSRHREYRADIGSAQLVGKHKMIAALNALKGTSETLDQQSSAIASLKISGRRGALAALFSTHPNLDDRIKALGLTKIPPLM